MRQEQRFDVQSLQCQKNVVFYSGANDNKIFENLRRRWGSKMDVWEKRNIKKGSKQINFTWHVRTYSVSQVSNLYLPIFFSDGSCVANLT